MLPDILQVPVPTTQSCYGFQQNCPCYPPFQEQHAAFLLITAEVHLMALQNIFLPSSFSSRDSPNLRIRQSQNLLRSSHLSHLFHFDTIPVSASTCYRKQPFYYSNYDHHLSKTCRGKWHLQKHPAPTPIQTIQVPPPDAQERCVNKCICFRTTLWSPPATDGY